MKKLKLNTKQTYLVQQILLNEYVMTALCEYGYDCISDFGNLSEKEERLLLRYIGGDKTVKIEVV